MNLNVKPEKAGSRLNFFMRQFTNPVVLVVVGTAILSTHSFFIKNLYVNPAKNEMRKEINETEQNLNIKLTQLIQDNIAQNIKIDTNMKDIKDHEIWCDSKLSQELDKRPTIKELEPEFRAIKKNIESLEKTVNDSMQIIIQKLK